MRCYAQDLLQNMMNHATCDWIGSLRLAVGWACVAAAPLMRAGEADEVVAVFSSASPGYTRALLPDGKPQPEAYAFGEGGDLGGAMSDASIDRLRFTDIAQIIAPALAKGAYVPTREPGKTKLLIMVYWGTTIGTDGTSSSPQYQIAQALMPPTRAPMSPPPTGGNAAMASDPMVAGRGAEGQVNIALKNADDSAQQQSLMLMTQANHQRDKQDQANASVLGFHEELGRVAHYDSPAFARKRQDVIDQVEESRHYVVLLAFDFQLLAQHKEKKLLWETRFSIPQRRNDFGKQLAAMAES